MTTVRTEESWSGEPVLADVDRLATALIEPLETWLDLLDRTVRA